MHSMLLCLIMNKHVLLHSSERSCTGLWPSANVRWLLRKNYNVAQKRATLQWPWPWQLLRVNIVWPHFDQSVERIVFVALWIQEDERRARSWEEETAECTHSGRLTGTVSVRVCARVFLFSTHSSNRADTIAACLHDSIFAAVDRMSGHPN